MIKSFINAKTEELHFLGIHEGLHSSLLMRATMQLERLDAARRLGDLGAVRSNKLRELGGGRYAIAVSGGWWVSFHWCDGDAVDVAIEKVDKLE